MRIRLPKLGSFGTIRHVTNVLRITTYPNLSLDQRIDFCFPRKDRLAPNAFGWNITLLGDLAPSLARRSCGPVAHTVFSGWAERVGSAEVRKVRDYYYQLAGVRLASAPV